MVTSNNSGTTARSCSSRMEKVVRPVAVEALLMRQQLDDDRGRRQRQAQADYGGGAGRRRAAPRAR